MFDEKPKLSGLKNLVLGIDYAAQLPTFTRADFGAPSSEDRHKHSYYELESGQVLRNVHPADICAGRPCAIHHPSAHLLSDKPRVWKNETIYRTCWHGVDHPDYDALANLLDRQGWLDVRHECCEDNCCGLPEVVEIHG